MSKTAILIWTSHLLLLLSIVFSYTETKLQKGGGEKDFKPTLDSEFQKSLLQSSLDSYQILLSTIAQLQEKETTVFSEVPAAIPAGGNFKGNQYVPSLIFGPLASPEMELSYFEVQLYTSFRSHFYRNALSSFLLYVIIEGKHWKGE